MNPSPYQEALDFLFGRLNYERLPSMPYRKAELKLRRMQLLLEMIGDPQNRLKIVHVAGTKGKGSTCNMIESIARASGYRTGLFTSPHLHRIEERFVVDGRICSEDEFVELLNLIRPAIETLDRDTSENNSPTYFEINTAIAFLLFARKQVDVAIIEVGLGGRLDSTNVCMPLISVITNISLDHVRQLGNTTAKIAREKAGIIKSGRPVVSGVRDEDAREVIQSVAREKESGFFQIDHDFFYQPGQSNDAPEKISQEPDNWICYQSSFDGIESTLVDVPVNLLGEHQLGNAATAIATCEQLRRFNFVIDAEAIRRGLSTVTCEARVEIVSSKPLVIVDAAHNIASVEALVRALRPYMNSRRRTLVFASTGGKDTNGMLDLLLPVFNRVILTRYLNNPRAVHPAKLRELIENWDRDVKGIEVEVFDDPKAAWQNARQTSDDADLICVTGSFFIAAEIREIIDQG